MKNALKSALLILAAAACIILLCAGTLAALWMAFVGACALFGALAEAMWDLAIIALFGLLTVALASVCCYAALLYGIRVCVAGLQQAPPAPDWSRLAMAALSVLAAIGMFWSTQGRFFMEVCMGADCLYVLLLILYIRMKRGKKRDPHRS